MIAKHDYGIRIDIQGANRKGKIMSSLRVESLRLCWLEAFIAVANEENISEAANVLGVSQPTVSRYMQHLQKWLGKTLIEPGKISDPDDPRLSVALTDEGREFVDIAERAVRSIQEFRGEAGERRSAIKSYSGIVDKLQADLTRRDVLHATESIQDNINYFKRLIEFMNNDLPMDALVSFDRSIRKFYSTYESTRDKERRFRKAVKRSRRSGRDIRIDEVADLSAIPGR